MKAIKLNGEFISATDVVALASKLDIDCLSCQTHLFDTAIMILVGNGYTIGMYKDTLVITNQRSVVLNSDLLQTIDRLKKQIAELEADNAEFRQLIRDWSIVLEQDDYFQLWHVESVRQAMLEINKEREYIAELEAERRWIPVGERLPEEKQNVLALDKTGTAYHWEYSRSLSNIFVGYYTHWMPLPELPEVKE